MAVVNEAQMNNVVQPGLKKAFAGALNEEADQSLVDVLYDVVSSDKADEDYLEMEDIGSMPDFTGELNYTEFKQGNSKTLTPTEKALGLAVQRKFFDDDLYGVVEAMVKEIAEVARYRMEEDAAAPYVNAFNSSYTMFDGLSLCNSAHTFVSTSSTQSNAGSTAFSYAALDATLQLYRKFKNSQDRFMRGADPDLLIGPIELETQMTEVINSELRAGTTDNDINVFNRKFRIVVTPFLSDTNNWFLASSKRMKKWSIWQQRVPVEFNRTQDFDTYVKKWSAYMRYIAQPIHWPFVYGHAV
jgi:phage major head subunit gpT-like protein